MLPAMVNEIALSRLPSFIYSTLPKYSPTRLGVVTENDVPDKMALKEVKKLTCCILCIETFHLNASIPQLTIINRNTAIKLNNNGLPNEALIVCHDLSRSGWRRS